MYIPYIAYVFIYFPMKENPMGAIMLAELPKGQLHGSLDLLSDLVIAKIKARVDAQLNARRHLAVWPT